MRFRLSDHAKQELVRRGIPVEALESVLQRPEQVVSEPGGRKAHQSRVDFRGTMFLVRAIVDDRPDPAVVITVYRTSKIGKYWRTE